MRFTWREENCGPDIADEASLSVVQIDGRMNDFPVRNGSCVTQDK